MLLMELLQRRSQWYTIIEKLGQAVLGQLSRVAIRLDDPPGKKE